MIFERVAPILAEHFNVPEEDISEEMTFEELGADEIDLIDLATILEDEFDIEIHEDEIKDIETVEDLVSLIRTAVELSA
ncbi:MAG TPA: acyl carrier protein [Clostridiales bacterium]|jgi:acyl carrier protein|nr:acyl carrier protein [Clostridiales bacterium]HOJ35158.1 acyl carrier protein [Clostridiales bacterium]HOL79723.1 acyl carrier protein [Clostridiales bacterium]HPP68499.1 acyl carrier protein [Clostridiales bacterium]HPU67018.1 acyl carrier protein [Clostridiales bacterium]